MDWISIALALVLVLANGFFVATEFAIARLRPGQVDKWVSDGRPGAKSVHHAVDHIDAYLAACQLGITVANGLFEPSVAASYVHGNARTPPETSTEGMPGEILEFINDAWRVSLGQRLATGMQLSVDFISDRRDLRKTIANVLAMLQRQPADAVS